MKKTALYLVAAVMLVAFVMYPRRSGEKDAVFDDSIRILRESNAGLVRFKLDNGMICLVKEDHSAPTASIQFWIGTGSMHEQEYLGSGLSHAIEHMIFKGTARRKPGDITREINDAGGDINAYTSFDRTVFYTDIPSKKWKVGLDVLSDALMNASFPEDEWEKEREVIIREIAMGMDNPERVIGKLLFDTAYRVHPYRYPVIGYEDMFRSLTRSDIHTFFRRHYVPNNVIAVIVGDIDVEEVRKELVSTFSGFARQPYQTVILPAEPVQISPRVERKTGAYNVTRIEMAYHTVAVNHPDAPALDMLAEITGKGRSSLLVKKILEQKKLVHTIDAWSYTPREPGLFGISASLALGNEEQAIAAIENEIAEWGVKPFPAGEIEKARRKLLRAELSSLQNMGGQANSYASGEFYTADPRYAVIYLERLAQVTPEALMRVAGQYLNTARQSLVILAPEVETVQSGTELRKESVRPSVEKLSLPNGIPLIVREDNRLPFIHVSFAFDGGLLSETAENNGITQLMAELLVRGTKTRTAEEIAEITESMGATLRVFAGRNSFGIQLQCLAGDIEKCMDLMADCLINSVFPESEIEKQKEIQLAAIDRQYERPMYIAMAALRKSLFPDHPYGWDVLGSREAVEGFTRDELREHARRYITAGKSAVSVFGNITADDSFKLAERHFRKIPAGKSADHVFKKSEPALPCRTKQREPKEQAIVLMGFPGTALKDPRYDAVTVLQSLMSGLSSGLSTKIREDRGLAYYSGAYDISGVEPGMFVLYAGTREDAVDEVENLMKEEIVRITGGGLNQEEVDRARSQLIADYEMQLQDTGTIAMLCALNEIYGLGYSHLFTTDERLNTLTMQDIAETAQSILSTDKHAVSLVLPMKEEEGDKDE